MINQIVFHW